MIINNFQIGENRTFIIAEIGNNHNGSYENAIILIDEAFAAGADCVKFQMRVMDAVYRKKSLNRSGEDLGTEYVLDLLDRFQLSSNEHEKLKNYCKEIGITYMCTPWDINSVQALEKMNVPAYKVASADLTNMPLIESLANLSKPLILSTGMSTEEEVLYTVEFLNSKKSDFALLHCNSTYPAPLHDINLKWMNRLSKIHPLIGYSGHERGISVSLAAVSLGATIIEKHLTLDRKMEGPDHAASLLPEEFKSLVSSIREIEDALGDGKVRLLSQGEMINRENLAKSLVATKDLPKGTIIQAEHIKALSPGQGLSPQYFDKLIGKKLTRKMNAEDYFFSSDIGGYLARPTKYSFKRPWGIPVRFHDLSFYTNTSSPDLVEFHLSYSDLELNIEDYIDKPLDCEFVVHAPELFAKSRLMDLASPDDDYRKFSIIETQKVINITEKLNKYFPKTSKPLLVANIGGFTMDEPLHASEIENRYEIFSKSLKELDLSSVELIPQTMAPFPWHFGGQRFQNLFVHSDEIIDWCTKLNLRMCFDISHSKLMSNYYNVDFYEFARKIAPITAHLHLGDASGLNGEGLQIGSGDIDFKKLSTILNNFCPNASFIPEIWQGHKNNGEGFWIALKSLNRYF